MNKYQFKTTISESIGNVIPNDIAEIEGISLEDRGGYFAVILNEGGAEQRITKKYWRYINE